VDLTCAYFDEEIQKWKALNCPEEKFSEFNATCCARTFAKVALISTEYLEVSHGTAEEIEVPKFTMTNLIGAIVSVVALLISIVCCIRQLVMYARDRKRYALIEEKSVQTKDNRLST
jgi:tellurite resistance protein TehA-like permease